MLCSKFLALVFTISFMTQALAWQKPQGTQPAAAKRGGLHAEASDAVASKQASIQRVRNLAGSALLFKGIEPKVRGLVVIGDVLWKAGDEAYARQLYIRAFDALKAAESSSANTDGATAKDADSGKDAKNSRPNFAALRVFLLHSLSMHDAQLAKQFFLDVPSPSGSDDTKVVQAFEVALSFVNDGDSAKAVEFADRGLGDGLSNNSQAMLLLNLLSQLHKKDAHAADELFSQALTRLVAQPNTGADALLITGNYLFTSNLSRILPEEGSVLVSPVSLGGISLAADVSVDRPDINPAAARAFLLAAGEILARPAEESEARRRRAAAYLLAPKASRYAPEVLQRLADLSALSGVTSPPPQYQPHKPPSPDASVGPDADLSADSKKADAISDSAKRDEFIVASVKRYYLRGDFDSARALAGKAGDTALRERLLSLIDFRQAARLIEDGQTEAAQHIVEKMSPDFGRSLVRLALAKALLAKKENGQALAAVEAALKEIREKLTGPRRASLLLVATEILGGIEPSEAAVVLHETVRAFNDVAAAGQDDAFGVVHMGNRSVNFDTSLKGLTPGNFDVALRPLVRYDPDQTIGAVLELKNERMLERGIESLARDILGDGAVR
jgi:hypothetical protein